ncbi:MAG: Fe-Mn family superoxide dismutase [Bacilli bacterium]|nr:Fe-Mn family superoxide dismutase [Bacilli bacterium]
MKQINKTYGSYEVFWDEFKQKALSLKGSGYTFLVLKENSKLDIINTKNQDTPLSLGYIPLFTIDLWEHAYYLNYENDKVKYIDNFEDIADFTYASNLYNNITK